MFNITPLKIINQPNEDIICTTTFINRNQQGWLWGECQELTPATFARKQLHYGGNTATTVRQAAMWEARFTTRYLVVRSQALLHVFDATMKVADCADISH